MKKKNKPEIANELVNEEVVKKIPKEKKLSKGQIRKQEKKAKEDAKIEAKKQAKLDKKAARKGRGKRIAKRLLVLLIIGAVLYVSYLFLLKPNGFKSGGANVSSFITNIDDSKVCEDHFDIETLSVCETIVDSLDGSVVVLEEARDFGDEVRLHLTVDGNDVFFDVTFVTYEPSGLRKYIGGDYYKIDIFE